MLVCRLVNSLSLLSCVCDCWDRAPPVWGFGAFGLWVLGFWVLGLWVFWADSGWLGGGWWVKRGSWVGGEKLYQKDEAVVVVNVSWQGGEEVLAVVE